MKKAVLSIIIFILATGSAHAADVSHIATARFEARYESNISKAKATSDQRDDFIATLSGSFGRRLQITPADRVSLTMDIQKEAYQYYSDFGNVKVGLSASWFRKYEIGRGAPWTNIRVSAARIDSRSSQRDGSEYTLSVAAGKAVGNRFNITIAHFVRSNTADNEVYTNNSYTTSGALAYTFRNNLKISYGYGLSRGDIIAMCFPVDIGSPSAWEDVFGGWAYRRVFKTHIYSFTAAYPVGYTTSIYAGYERLEARWLNRPYPLEIYRIGIARNLN